MKKLFAVFLFCVVARATETCPVCGMKVPEKTRVGFSATHQAKPLKFCSYSCARSFQKRHPQTPLSVLDYNGGPSLDASTAWFLIDSEKVSQEVGFSMPPLVVGFKDEASARRFNGRVVHGFSAVTQR